MRVEHRDPWHAGLPHVVKFSGGRSSAYLLEKLIEGDALDGARGDVVLFNNTSAEHPATYDFVGARMDAAEAAGVPCFILEYCTYEYESGGRWRRRPAFRLARRRPRPEPDGYHHRGEVYEEYLSHELMLPDTFKRMCTARLKIQPTQRFLRQWLTGADGLDALGHDGPPQQTPEDLMHWHRRMRGQLDKDLLLRLRSYEMSRPAGRPVQRFADYSPPARRFPLSKDRSHVVVIGIRGDERGRAERFAAREEASAKLGEYYYLPLADAGVRASDVEAHWRGRPDDLGFAAAAGYGNCVHCFMKRPRDISRTARRLLPVIAANPLLADTPTDIDWWVRVEQRYARPGDRRGRAFGFWARPDMSFEALRDRDPPQLELDISHFVCECTD